MEVSCVAGRSSHFVFSVPHDVLLGRWRLVLDLFGRVFVDDVGVEPGSIISELGGFPVKEAKFRREMERLRSSRSQDLNISKIERDRPQLIVQVKKPFRIFLSVLLLLDAADWKHRVIPNVVDANFSYSLFQAFKEFNSFYNSNLRRANSSQPPMVVNRVKVTFQNEPGEGTGVARSFYTALAEALLANHPLPNLEGAQVG